MCKEQIAPRNTSATYGLNMWHSLGIVVDPPLLKAEGGWVVVWRTYCWGTARVPVAKARARVKCLPEKYMVESCGVGGSGRIDGRMGRVRRLRVDFFRTEDSKD